MRRAMKAAREQAALLGQAGMNDPGPDGFPRRLGNLELDGPLSLLLQYDRPRGHGLPVADIPDPELYEVAGSKFAVNGQIEQGEFPPPLGELQTNADGPDLSELERRLLTNELALVPGRADGGGALL